MASDATLRVVGTIRTIELYTLGARFEHMTTRQAKIQLDVERAIGDAGQELDVLNLAGVQFQGPAELLPRFVVGDRVQIETSADSSLQIASIRKARAVVARLRVEQGLCSGRSAGRTRGRVWHRAR